MRHLGDLFHELICQYITGKKYIYPVTELKNRKLKGKLYHNDKLSCFIDTTDKLSNSTPYFDFFLCIFLYRMKLGNIYNDISIITDLFN